MGKITAVEQPVKAEPSQRPRKPGTFTAETARKAAQASVQARALKAQRLMEPDFPAPPPLSADVQGKPGVLAVSLPREQSEVSAIGDRVRLKMAKALEAEIDLLVEKAPTKRDELTGRNGTAQATKTLSDSADTVFGWGEGSIPGLIVVGEVGAIEPEVARVTGVKSVEPVIEVQPVMDGMAPAPNPSLGAGPVEV